MLAKIRSAAVQGLEAYPIDVEVDVGGGLPAFAIVGLPDTAVQEAKERVRAAIRNSNYDVPSRKITVNLAPADVRKEGPAFDLPMAVGILAATEQIRAPHLDGTVLLGELSLDGGVRPVAGLLSIALAARGLGMSRYRTPFGHPFGRPVGGEEMLGLAGHSSSGDAKTLKARLNRAARQLFGL